MERRSFLKQGLAAGVATTLQAESKPPRRAAAWLKSAHDPFNFDAARKRYSIFPVIDNKFARRFRKGSGDMDDDTDN